MRCLGTGTLIYDYHDTREVLLPFHPLGEDEW